jgi:dihydrofolate synthase/folylpolyglutamate synthase
MADLYQQTLDYLYERLPVFHRIGKAALKPSLDNTIKLCVGLDNPQNKFKSVHIAGTNGKGSTSHALAAVLQKAGYKTGLYTSPHLIDFRERIKVDGKPVSKDWVVTFVAERKKLIEQVEPSFFEITVAMAFAYFAEQEVDIAVIETGLGGRLDSTNVITPLLSIITNISYDHKDLLGNTLAEIATEKAGIIKQGIPTLIGEQQTETERVFFEQSVHKQSTLHYAQMLWDLVRTSHDGEYQYYKAINKAHRAMYDLRTDLMGNYQVHNIKTVLTAAELLSYQGYKVPLELALQALSNVKGSTGLRGRWDKLQAEPLIIADVAHNPAGLKEVLQQWEFIKAAKKHVVLGFVRDKDVAEALALFPKDAIYYFTNAQLPRALPANELEEAAKQTGLSGSVHYTVAEAMQAARDAMHADDAMLVTGSFFIVGEAMEALHPEVAF